MFHFQVPPTSLLYHSLDFHINLTQPGVGRKANLAWIRKLELYKLNWFFFLLSNLCHKNPNFIAYLPSFWDTLFYDYLSLLWGFLFSYLRFLWEFFFLRFFFLKKIYILNRKSKPHPPKVLKITLCYYFFYIIFIFYNCDLQITWDIYIFTQGPRVENKEQHELKEKY